MKLRINVFNYNSDNVKMKEKSKNNTVYHILYTHIKSSNNLPKKYS